MDRKGGLRDHAKMKAAPQRAPLASFLGNGLFEIAPVAHRDDDTLRRLDDPAAVETADRLHRPKTRQRCAGYDLIDVAGLALDVYVAVRCAADRPVAYERRPHGLDRCRNGRRHDIG